MKKFIQNKLKDQKGLTLIELLAVIVILAIIAAIAIPAIGNIIENSRYSAVKSDATNGISAANIYFTENPDKTTVTATLLVSEGYLDSAGELPVSGSATATAAGAGVTLFKNVNPMSISTPAINFSGNKKITFTNATVNGINGDSKKGSDITDTGYTISQ